MFYWFKCEMKKLKYSNEWLNEKRIWLFDANQASKTQSLWTQFKRYVRASFCQKSFLQTSHQIGFAPECVRIWNFMEVTPLVTCSLMKHSYWRSRHSISCRFFLASVQTDACSDVFWDWIFDDKHNHNDRIWMVWYQDGLADGCRNGFCVV